MTKKLTLDQHQRPSRRLGLRLSELLSCPICRERTLRPVRYGKTTVRMACACGTIINVHIRPTIGALQRRVPHTRRRT